MKKHIAPVCAILLMAIGSITGCRAETSPPAAEYSLPELKYIILASFEDVFWCDPDFYPVGRPGQEELNALEQFSAIRADGTEFSAILKHLDLPDKAGYTDEEKLLIYREHKKLTYQVETTPSGDMYRFTLRVKEGQGERIEGTVTPSGELKVSKREPGFNTCPICLAGGTLIDTPDGPVPVEQLYEGMAMWTLDETGDRMMGIVLKTVMTPASACFQAVRVALSDGRNITASPGHPTGEEKVLGSYRVGDTLDGAVVMAVGYLDYSGFTYDLLPSGGTGFYWADGILLRSTISAE